ncbi:MAG: acyl carrier protein [Actinomycetota bacterium]|nr:acyl carrier protein [Actinomycetota bacterium]
MPGETVEVPVATAVTAAEVLAAVTQMIGEIIGEDYLAEIDVTMDSMVTEDLELESIEFVALAEQLRNRYGERVDFVDWIAGMELDQIILLTVGQLVEFVVGCLTS